jgi:hypothetical protein
MVGWQSQCWGAMGSPLRAPRSCQHHAHVNTAAGHGGAGGRRAAAADRPGARGVQQGGPRPRRTGGRFWGMSVLVGGYGVGREQGWLGRVGQNRWVRHWWDR